MAWYNPLSWGKKRTEADIQKARLLEAALRNLNSGDSLIRYFAVDLSTHPELKRVLAELKENLDATHDTKYTVAIDRIITKIKSLGEQSPSLNYEDKLREMEILKRDFEILRQAIKKELRRL